MLIFEKKISRYENYFSRDLVEISSAESCGLNWQSSQEEKRGGDCHQSQQLQAATFQQ